MLDVPISVLPLQIVAQWAHRERLDISRPRARARSATSGGRSDASARFTLGEVARHDFEMQDIRPEVAQLRAERTRPRAPHVAHNSKLSLAAPAC
jgi:hypothetical protein